MADGLTAASSFSPRALTSLTADPTANTFDVAPLSLARYAPSLPATDAARPPIYRPLTDEDTKRLASRGLLRVGLPPPYSPATASTTLKRPHGMDAPP